MKQIWKSICTFFQTPEQMAEQVFEDIENAYTSSARHYHNFLHINHLLKLIDQYSAQISDIPSLQLTAFFHDFVYDPDRKDNEFQSALYAQKSMKNMNVPPKTCEKVYNYILATQHHKVSNDFDLQFFLDADLSVLGSELSVYQQYATQIRHEYKSVPMFLYKIGRTKVLKKMLERQTLFPILTHLESQAKQNLCWEIDDLRIFKF
ncbi:MAG: hypothetical protein EAZ97_15040 [Bacteroidetes bacterium]|nr:MAG: hypothetical protein EAZ97_15040 [Bacteroidota bacterium]